MISLDHPKTVYTLLMVLHTGYA